MQNWDYYQKYQRDKGLTKYKCNSEYIITFVAVPIKSINKSKLFLDIFYLKTTEI